MTSKVNRWKLGAFVVGSVATAIAVAIWMGLQSLNRKYEIYYSYFNESVDGLSIGSPVKFRGIPVGKVTGISAAADRRTVEVESQIFLDKLDDIGLAGTDDSRFKVALDEGFRAQIVHSLLTGVAFIQTDFFDPIPPRKPIVGFAPKKPTVPSVPSSSKQIEAGLLHVLDVLPELVASTQKLIDDVDESITKADLPGLTADGRKLIENIDDKVQALDTEEINANLDKLLVHADDLIAELRAQDGPLRETAAHVESLITELEKTVADSDLPATTLAFRRLADRFAVLGRDADKVMPQLSAALEALRGLLEMLRRDPGALLHGKSPQPPIRGDR